MDTTTTLANAIDDVMSARAAADPATAPAAAVPAEELERLTAFYASRLTAYGYDAATEPAAHRRLAGWCARHYLGLATRGLLLLGNTGTGKTMGAMIVCRLFGGRILTSKDVQLAWQCSLASQDHRVFTEAVSPPTVEIPRTGGRRSRLLLVDDLGGETITHYYAHKSESMEELISWAYDAYRQDGLLLLLTTNLRREEIQPRYGVRVRSRLDEMCWAMSFTGRDRRAPPANTVSLITTTQGTTTP